MERLEVVIPLSGSDLMRHALVSAGLQFTESTGVFFAKFTIHTDDADKARSVIDQAKSEYASQDAW